MPPCHAGVRCPGPQYPEIFDVRIHPRVITSQTGTKDLQQVTIQLRILYRPETEHLPEIFRRLGKDFDERVLPSIGNEVLKATVVRRALCRSRSPAAGR